MCVGLVVGHAQCAPFCDAAHPCPTGGVCVAGAIQTNGGLIGVCLVPDDCDLLSTSSCPAGLACTLDDSGGAFCLSPGGAKAGTSCSAVNDCMTGLGCFSGKCATYCDTTKPCAAPATCQHVGELPGHPALGVCE
jgi:hypothetical protein